MSFVLMGVFGVRLRRSLAKFRIRHRYTAAITAPSVSVCIPARNETHAMTQCLERVLASDYAKLEVIVYDDSSDDDTSYLIRSFAHAGVRFVPGSDLPDGWLGKNHAIDVLAREASGTFIVFIDVDTVIEPTTISQLVGYGLTEQVDMVSVLPSRRDTFRASVLFGHLRYFWELVLSTTRQPAASGALWMIRRHVLLDECGGMEPLRQAVVPESDLAKKLGTQRYHCLLGASGLGVSYEKKWRSQIETSIRLLYPRAGNSVVVAALYLLLLGCVVYPVLVVAAVLFVGWSTISFFALGSVVGAMILYAVYLRHMWTDRRWMMGVVLWPVVIVQECILLALSIVGYIRGTITWKGRPIRRL